MVTRTLAENAELADSINILFPEDVCDRSTWHRFGDYGVHNMVAAWRPRSSVPGRLLTRLWRDWNWSRVVAKGRARGKTRSVGSIGQAENRECSATS